MITGMMRARRGGPLTVLVAAALLVPLVAGAADLAALHIQAYEPPKPAPELALPDLEGRTVRLGDLRGKVVLAFFWTTW
jgi:hypothetical protein